jgi:hypothetical protein
MSTTIFLAGRVDLEPERYPDYSFRNPDPKYRPSANEPGTLRGT